MNTERRRSVVSCLSPTLPSVGSSRGRVGFESSVLAVSAFRVDICPLWESIALWVLQSISLTGCALAFLETSRSVSSLCLTPVCHLQTTQHIRLIRDRDGQPGMWQEDGGERKQQQQSASGETEDPHFASSNPFCLLVLLLCSVAFTGTWIMRLHVRSSFLAR